MEKAYREALNRLRDGETVAVATVVRTWGSTPHAPGAAMLVTQDGIVIGNVSGGCVEADLVAAAQDVLSTGQPLRKRYGFDGDDLGAVGLSCGGELDIVLERLTPLSVEDFAALANAAESGRPHTMALILSHPQAAMVGRRLLFADTVGPIDPAGALGAPTVDAALATDAEAVRHTGHSDVRWYHPDGARQQESCDSGIEVLLLPSLPPARMLIFGAADFVRTTARIGKFLGFHVTVCDARGTFATPQRFPHADEVVVRWPHDYFDTEAAAGRIDERTVVLVLTHDERFDVPLLVAALRADTAYVGAMGSRRTHRERMAKLRAAGLTEAELERLCSPVGLDLGGRTAEETAISIAAEIIARRSGRTGQPLSHTEGSLH